MEPTSEQELKQLLDEGKITEQEYQELLEAIRQKETTQKPVEKSTGSKPRTGYGKAALILMIAGVLLPIAGIVASLVFNYIGIRFKMFLFMPCFFIGILCELLAFIFGIIGWKTAQGKIAAIGVPCLGLLLVPGLLFLWLFSHKRVVVAEGKEWYLEPYQVYQLDSMEGVLTRDGVEFDDAVSADGNGSLKIVTGSADKAVIRLFETGPMGIENRTLVYSAQVKSDLEYGRAYLEMWCEFDGKGEFFSRGLAQPISGSTNWTTLQTPFRLETGQMPANVKLNMVIEGVGTVWVDDIKLLSNPLD
ncbi:MAG: hypothetical protein IMF02_09350 [Proteobacteria bacterium]|nr:hypothetical protein [Pseudomonadota bacterium]